MTKRTPLIALLLLIAAAASATVFEPRSDRELAVRSDAVVIALVRDAVSRQRPDGFVVTDYHLIVEETLKGTTPDVITVTEVGGTVGTRFVVVADGAAYAPGERVLTFLQKRADGTWFTTSMAMGRFAIERDANGIAVATRHVDELPNDEPRRLDAFSRFIRGESVSYLAAAPLAHPPVAPNGNAKNYALLSTNSLPIRWPGCETSCPGGGVKFYVSGSMPFATSSSISAAMNAWTNDPGANIVLATLSGSPSSPTPGVDSQNVIYLSQALPNAGFCDGALACTLGGGSTDHQFDGDTWDSISDADIVISPSVTQSQFPTLMCHELGHAIGIRHSNQGTPSSSNAIMSSSVPINLGTTLQQWDKDAVDSIYGAGPVCAVPGSITTNPNGNTTVSAGQSVTLSVTVGAGTAPFHYQWYDGVSGNANNPVGTDSPSFTTPAINTVKNYWVKVVNGCGSADSQTITLTPQSSPTCQAPVIQTGPASQTIPLGSNAQLTVAHSGTPPFGYQWYQGNKGDLSLPMPGGINRDFTTPNLDRDTSFWVRVGNQCGFADSEAAKITVQGAQCTPPVFSLQPPSMILGAGQQTYLIAAAAPATSYQWYQGTAPDTSMPLNGQAPSNARYVNQLYIDILHRPADPAANGLVADLDANNLTRYGVALTVTGSNEYRALLINDVFTRYLHRSPSPSEVTFWMALFAGNAKEEQFQVQILGSPEYFALAGGTNEKLLKQLYKDVLQTDTPPAFNFNLLLGILNQTQSRTGMAELMLNDPGARQLLITGWFKAYLRRNPTAQELSAFIPQVGTNAYDYFTLSLILSSPEYFNFGTILPTGPLTATTSFWVRATNGACTNDSNTATVTIPTCQIPNIAVQPINVNLGVGNQPSLSVSVSDTSPLTYQWYSGTSGDTAHPVSGQTKAVFSGSPLDTPGTYPFWVRVSNACKSADSATAVVTVTCGNAPEMLVAAPPAIPSTESYVVKVETRLSIYAKFELQESTNADFSGATTMTSTNGSFTIPARTLVADTRFYYRARGFLACNSQQAGDYTKTSSTFVTAPLPPNLVSYGLVSNPCLPPQVCKLIQQFFIGGLNLNGKQALDASDTFFVTTDKPWITVSPESGPLTADGVNVTITVDYSQLPIGSTEASVTVTKVATSSSIGVLGSTVNSTPVSVSLVSAVTPKPKDTNAPANTLLIPAIAHAGGFGGSQFQSDVRLTNTSSQSITYQLTYTPSNTDGTQNGKSTKISVDGGTTVALNDIVKNFYGSGVANEPGSGSLEIRPLDYAGKDAVPSVQFVTAAASRTYNSTAKGTYGQFIPALPLANFLTKSDVSRISLQQVADSAAYRTNIGFAEGSGQPVDLLVTLFGAAGNGISQQTLHLLPYQQTQTSLAGFFGVPGGSVPEGRIEVEVTSDGGKVTAYASVLDNATSDPLLVLPIDPTKITSSRYVLPGVAELNNGAANFHTDMRVFNGGTSKADVTLVYAPQNNGTPTDARLISIDPGEVKVIDNVLPSLWNLTNTGGAVLATTDNDSQLVFTARTFSRDDKGGTYGQFIPGVTASDAVGLNERALNVVQLEQSPSFRSNVGLIEVTGNPVTVEIRGYAPDSKIVATTTRTLNPGEYTQLGSIMASMGFGNVYNGRISVRVIDGTGRVASYGSVIDNRTQDPTYVPAQ